MKDLVSNGYRPAGHATLLSHLGLPAYELGSAVDLEMAGREFLQSLRVIRSQFEITQRPQEDFDRLCERVEEWLRQEVMRVRFSRMQRSQTALDS